MNAQDAKNEQRPEWAKGLSEEQKNAIRREAIRMGKTPTDLVRLWILQLSQKLNDSSSNKHSSVA